MGGRGRSVLMEQLIIEVLNAFFVLRQAGQELDMVSESGGGLWGLMRILSTQGPQTLSAVARQRGVSRQYIQKIAAQLTADGLVRMGSDPLDRRAKRMMLTDRGKARYQELNQRFEVFAATLAPRFKSADLKTAADTVAGVRRALQESLADA